jgi:hypothetical protein
MKFDEKSNFFLNRPFFISMVIVAKFAQPIAIFLETKKGGFKIILDSFHQTS